MPAPGHFQGALAALLVVILLGSPQIALAQSRVAAVSVTRDDAPSGGPVDCVDSGTLFEATSHAAVAQVGVPALVLSAAASIAHGAAAPLFESAGAQAALADVITLSAPVPAARVTFVFRVTGSLVTQDAPVATATLQADVFGEPVLFETAGPVDETVAVTMDLATGVAQEVTLVGSARASVSRVSAADAGGVAEVGASDPARIRLEGVRIADAAGAPVEGASLVSALGHAYPVLGDPPGGLVAVGPAVVWLGFTPGQPHAPPVDLRAEVYRDGALIASGQASCVEDVPDRPGRAVEVAVPLGDLSDGQLESGAVLSLRLLARIGTGSDGLPCAADARRGNGTPLEAEGLRVYYGADTRPSRLGVELAGAEPTALHLASDGAPCGVHHPSHGVTALVLDEAAPAPVKPRCVQSGPFGVAGGNPWTEIGVWSAPPRP
jgi:hypothetical protein